MWLATKHKDFTEETRDLIWEATQHAYKIGDFWSPIAGYEDGGICSICHEREDMDHILTKCDIPPRTTAWNLAGKLWSRKYKDPLPDKLGCGLAKFLRDDKPDKANTGYTEC